MPEFALTAAPARELPDRRLRRGQPDKALWQPHRDQGGATRPGLGECRPLECGNVATTLTALRAELDHIDDELAVRPSLPPLLVHRLRSRREQIARFLDRHAPETR